MEFTLIPLSTPDVEPVTVKQARNNSSIDDSEFDLELEQSIREAREFLETRTEATLITRQWRMTLNAFPCRFVGFKLPRWPVQSIDLIKYLDGNGDLQTWDNANYRLIPNHIGRSELTLMAGASWPSTSATRGSIEIDFTAGFGDEPKNVPALWMRAMLLLTSQWFENREAALTGTITSEIMYGVEPIISALMDPEDDLI